MKIEQKNAVAFVGYRTPKIIAAYPREPQVFDRISDRLSALLTILYDKGYRTFLSGMTPGFDMLAAEAVVRLRALYSDVRLVAVVPYDGYEDPVAHEEHARYKQLCILADERIVVARDYYHDVYMGRSDFLLDNCSILVVFHTFMNGGALYTANNARRRNIATINLANYLT